MRDLDFSDRSRGRFGDDEAQRSDLMDFSVTVKHQTVKAYLVRDAGTGKEAWFPKSQCEVRPDDRSPLHVLTCPERLAKEKGFI